MDIEEDSLMGENTHHEMDELNVSPIRGEERITMDRPLNSIRGPPQRITRNQPTLRDLSESMNRSMDEVDARKITRNNIFTRPRGMISVAPAQVLARERMRSLKDFYLKERKPFDSLVKEEFKKRGMPEDMQAQ